MTTLPEEAVKAACEAYKLEDDRLSGIGMMRALEDAAPHLASVRVKKLEWNEYNDEQGIPDRWDAEASSIGVFYSIEIQHDGFRVVFDHEAVGAVGLFDTLEAAKAAAQADYAARILSALEPSANACQCTKIQQDETCPVGYPSLLCEICDGKGVVQPFAAAFAIIDRPIVGIENRTPQEVHDILRDRIKHALSAPSAAPVQVFGKSEQLGTKGRYEARYCKYIPTDCCDYGVIDHSAGKEVCRVWKEEDASRIAELLNGVSQPSAARELALEEAARNLIAVRYDTYTARNGKLCSIEGDDGEKAWIVPFDAMADLESALSSPDHADAGKVEGDGWLPIESAPKDGTEILAWRKDCGWFIASFTSCSAFPLSQSEIDELDEETLFKEDWFTQWPQALRLEDSEVPTHWRPLPSAPASEGAE